MAREKAVGRNIALEKINAILLIVRMFGQIAVQVYLKYIILPQF